MSAGTSASPYTIGVNECIHTEGQARVHSHCSSQLFTPLLQGATAVKSEIGSIENILFVCRNPLETSRDNVGGRDGELSRNHPYGPILDENQPPGPHGLVAAFVAVRAHIGASMRL